MIIESEHNQTFKTLLSLTSSKGLKAEGLFLLSGEKLIREFLKNPNLEIAYEIMLRDSEPLSAPANALRMPANLFSQLDVLGTKFNILALKQPEIPVIPAQEIASYKPSGIEIALPTGDPGNLGALIRSCEAFAVSRIILTQEAAHPFLPKSIKASAGSVLRANIARGPALAEFPSSCIALDLDGTPIDKFDWPRDALLLAGEEGPGFGGRIFPNRISIPTSGVESLNVLAAVSIALSRLPRT